jgi:hypothetical protein
MGGRGPSLGVRGRCAINAVIMSNTVENAAVSNVFYRVKTMFRVVLVALWLM